VQKLGNRNISPLAYMYYNRDGSRNIITNMAEEYTTMDEFLEWIQTKDGRDIMILATITIGLGTIAIIWVLVAF
jgi:hypothetical protein